MALSWTLDWATPCHPFHQCFGGHGDQRILTSPNPETNNKNITARFSFCFNSNPMRLDLVLACFTLKICPKIQNYISAKPIFGFFQRGYYSHLPIPSFAFQLGWKLLVEDYQFSTNVASYSQFHLLTIFYVCLFVCLIYSKLRLLFLFRG